MKLNQDLGQTKIWESMKQKLFDTEIDWNLTLYISTLFKKVGKTVLERLFNFLSLTQKRWLIESQLDIGLWFRCSAQKVSMSCI